MRAPTPASVALTSVSLAVTGSPFHVRCQQARQQLTEHGFHYQSFPATKCLASSGLAARPRTRPRPAWPILPRRRPPWKQFQQNRAARRPDRTGAPTRPTPPPRRQPRARSGQHPGTRTGSRGSGRSSLPAGVDLPAAPLGPMPPRRPWRPPNPAPEPSAGRCCSSRCCRRWSGRPLDRGTRRRRRRAVAGLPARVPRTTR
jgi:hypothetical protein